jgi:DNA-binding transcriptional MerR regulator
MTTPMTDAHELLKIGDFARVAGTNLRTLRYYEELGLLEPAARSQGGFRYYRRTQLNRLNMIRDLQDLGLNLERIRDLMSTREVVDEREKFLARVREALHEQDRLLSERVKALEEQRAGIARALAKLHDCERCRHAPQTDNNFCEPCTMTGQSLPETISALF